VRQEQEAASTQILEVAPGVLRLQLPIRFTGLGHVNTYALEDRRGFALVDPGLPGQKSWRSLQDRMKRAGIPMRRVHTVLITHSHPDHFGGAGLLAERTGARVVASTHFDLWWDPEDTGEEELEVAGARPAGTGSTPSGRRGGGTPTPFGRPTPWGGRTMGPSGTQKVKFRLGRTVAKRWFRTPRVTTRLDDADHISLAGREWYAMHTPGHTADHLCLHDPETGTLLSGDHVLPTITPHISGLIDGDPLAMYVRSLDRVAGLEGVTRVLPAHGQPFDDLVGRVAAIKEHHDDRLERLRQISDGAGWASVEDLTHELFSKRSWGAMAESETYAHLEHLRFAGQAERREDAGKLLYLVR
jgi:glyoxylase-like metal-dependent hydrolase (beta-lactamase superfamily II)